MSVQTELDRLNTAKNSLKTAIDNKGVSVPENTKLDGYSALVEQIESIADVPVYNGETEADNFDDGKTRLYITVPKNAMEGLPPPRSQVKLTIRQSVSNGVTIDWGDESEPVTLSGTGVVRPTHTYTTGGDYIIQLSPSEGCTLGLNGEDSSGCLIGSSAITDKIYLGMLKKVNIGANVSNEDTDYAFYLCYNLLTVVMPNNITLIGRYMFRNCGLLSKVVIPNNVTSIGSYAFYGCEHLSDVVIPNGVTSIGDYVFRSCSSITNVVIPNGVTSIGSYAFYGCESLPSLVIPSNVISIGDRAFGSCGCMKEYRFLSLIPPTITSTNVFSNIPSDCIIYVPKGSAEAYKAATNWTTVADHIQEEPA